MRPTRRTLLRALPAALLGGAFLPRLARADGAGERKFLFIFCPGGWDPAWALAPVFGSVADMPPGAVAGSAGGIDYVADPLSPSVGTFFSAYGGQSCLLHGVESRSVAHDVCLRLILTGSNVPGRDDWPLRLAALGSVPRVMPYVNLSGPTYAGSSVSALVRVGENGQLAALLDGSATLTADLPGSPPPDDISAMLDSLLSGRAERLVAGATPGRAATIAGAAALSEARRTSLLAVGSELDLAGGSTLAEHAELALECLQRGLSRVAMVEFYGHMGLTWDTHGANNNQSAAYDELFGALSGVMTSLRERPGELAPSLADEVCVVVMSEMGRYPLLNSRQGKEHWTYTSALLLGAGVRGGQSIGGYDEETYRGVGVDLETGGPGGSLLVPDHLGATLLAIGGHNVEAELPGAEPIAAALA